MFTENKLTLFHPKKSPNPTHIGIIPDGSGRWAVANGITILESYTNAMHKLREVLTLVYDQQIRSASVYLSSIQNLRRSPENIEAFCRAEAFFCDTLLPQIVTQYDTKVIIAGNRNALPNYLSLSLSQIEHVSQNNKTKRLYLCVAYNPLEELVEAFQKAPTPNDFIDYLWVNEPLDLVIRTTDANLFSNFLPLQSGYARLYIIDKLFNDISTQDIKNILDEFAELNRRFGD